MKTLTSWQDMTDEALVEKYGRLKRHRKKMVETKTQLTTEAYYSFADLEKEAKKIKIRIGEEQSEFGIEGVVDYYFDDKDFRLYLVARRHQTIHERAQDIRKSLKDVEQHNAQAKALTELKENKERKEYERLRAKFEKTGK